MTTFIVGAFLFVVGLVVVVGVASVLVSIPTMQRVFDAMLGAQHDD